MHKALASTLKNVGIIFMSALFLYQVLPANAFQSGGGGKPSCEFISGTVKCGGLGFDHSCEIDIGGQQTQTFTRRNESALFALVESAKINASEWSKVSTTCTTGINNMAYLFQNAAMFNKPIGHWDTSSVILMYAMFSGASSFNQSLSEWDTSEVTDMSFMFAREPEEPISRPPPSITTSSSKSFSIAMIIIISTSSVLLIFGVLYFFGRVKKGSASKIFRFSGYESSRF
jgi:surface protein